MKILIRFIDQFLHLATQVFIYPIHLEMKLGLSLIYLVITVVIILPPVFLHDFVSYFKGKDLLWKSPFLPLSIKWLTPAGLTNLVITWIIVCWPFSQPSLKISWLMVPIAVLFLSALCWHVWITLTDSRKVRGMVYILIHYFFMCDVWFVTSMALSHTWL